MQISYGRIFKKMFNKQSRQIQDKFNERLMLLIKNQTHSLLNTHLLHGEWLGCKSINITGNIRAVFEEIGENHIEFIAIGSHSELYS